MSVGAGWEKHAQLDAGNRSLAGVLCNTVGSAYVGSNPTPATLKSQVRPGAGGYGCRVFCLSGSGTGDRWLWLWASGGPDPRRSAA
jgi:hypothetical protein